MTTIIADVGVLALYLLFTWLGSAIVASYLSSRKGWGEQPGLASGLLTSIVAPIVWLVIPRRPLTLAPGAAAALVFSISAVFFSPLAPFAWKYANGVEQSIAKSEGELTGAKMVVIARILAIIGTAFLVVQAIVLIALTAGG
jgi:hypothetical protein